MTKLIPLDAAIAAITIGHTITQHEKALRAIPTTDPAAIREAALREAADAKAFFHGTKTYKPIMRPWRDAIFALIGEKK